MPIFDKARLPDFLWGIFVGVIVTIAVPVILCYSLIPSWLVVENRPVKADAVIVLGGGDASRLRKTLELHETGFARELVLVDRSKSDWDHIANTMCPDCVLEGKKVTYVTGSTSTQTDAQLTLPVCLNKGFRRVLVVTDPYHSRRANIVFKRVYAKNDIEVTMLHTGDYRNWAAPYGNWRDHRATRDLIWLEMGKIASLMLPFVK